MPYSGLSLNEYAYLNTLFESIKQELESNYVKRKEAINTLTQLLFIRIERVRMHKSSTGASPRHLSIFYSLLEEHFNTDKNVASYASRLNITSKQLNRLCLKFLGKNASKLIEERINLEAMRLLSYSSASIKEIAFGLGFEDPAYFSRYFKRINSISPNDFKTTMSDKYHSMVV